MSAPRKIFNYDNQCEWKIIENLSDKAQNYENSVSACGCLFFRVINGQVQLLLIKYADPKWPRLDDFGGKIDLEDESIHDAMVREITEETNGVINAEVLHTFTEHQTFYTKNSKYLLKVIQVGGTVWNNTEIFGFKENKDDDERTVSWYNYADIKDNLAFRLLFNRDLIAYLDSLGESLEA